MVSRTFIVMFFVLLFFQWWHHQLFHFAADYIGLWFVFILYFLMDQSWVKGGSAFEWRTGSFWKVYVFDGFASLDREIEIAGFLCCWFLYSYWRRWFLKVRIVALISGLKPELIISLRFAKLAIYRFLCACIAILSMSTSL